MRRHGWVRNTDDDWVYRQLVQHAITGADGAGET